jgi:molybdopterin molybdotransferase
VIQEEATRDGDHVVIKRAQGPDHIRPEGGDFRAGETLLAAGSRLDPWRLALAAAAGSGGVSVWRRPRVIILSTGEEIVEPGGDPSGFQIFNSGGTALAALARLWGGEPRVLSSVGDSAGSAARALSAAGGDLIVTLGGASVGDHDLVRTDLATLGLTLDVESIAVRPGKPTFFGVLGDGRRVLGLPGNPASALVCAELFLRPLLMALQGAKPERRPWSARTTAALAANGGREHWMRAELGGAADGALMATPFADQDSSLVKVFARADALIRRASGAPRAAIGDPVEVLVLERML